MKRTHLSVVIVLSIILLIAAGTLSVSSEPVPEKEKTNEELVQEIRQEFAIFMKEYRTYTDDPKAIRREEQAMEEKIDEFLRSLKEESSDPYAAKKDLDRWSENRQIEALKRAEEKVSKKGFQTKVFFGGWAVFFAIVVALFLIKFFFNVIQGWYLNIYDYTLDLFGYSRPQLYEHISPLSTAHREAPKRHRKQPSSNSFSAPRHNRNHFYFCEVFANFINPWADKNRVSEILSGQMDQDHTHKIGRMLRDAGLLTDDEVRETLEKQKYYRSFSYKFSRKNIYPQLSGKKYYQTFSPAMKKNGRGPQASSHYKMATPAPNLPRGRKGGGKYQTIRTVGHSNPAEKSSKLAEKVKKKLSAQEKAINKYKQSKFYAPRSYKILHRN
ncbi:MAG: hypothetical protein IIA62_06215 [Nitrospinae bacterium]|nr:hypothetical protein [Nitrospinota bacterium]